MPDNSLVDIPLDPSRAGDSTMAGGESTRQSFYGDRAVRLDLKLLPQLDGGDVWVEEEQLAELHAETLLLLQHLAPAELSYWSYRLGNIISAIERASMFEDGVVYIG